VTFEDTAHFHNGGIVPGDGVNVLYTMLLGLNRARYLMLMGQVLKAQDAKDLGWSRSSCHARSCCRVRGR
jgi:enoyl-CoA hydratase/carnithine racemase